MLFRSSFDWKPVIESAQNIPYILDYTLENTISNEIQQSNHHYITTLNLECIYVPANWYVMTINNTIESVSAQPNTTFYYYSVEQRCYNSKEALAIGIKTANPSAVVDETNSHHYAGVTTYPNGECYFAYRIRHSDFTSNGDDAVMKYGIVRNNIYRVTIDRKSVV